MPDIYPFPPVATPEGTVALEAGVAAVILAIRSRQVIPLGDYGGPQLYWFSVSDWELGNIIYTVFDRGTSLGLASYTVRYGAATTIGQVLFNPMPRSEIALQYTLLPPVALPITGGGFVVPR